MVSFKKCLTEDPNHYGANIYLGDLMLESGKNLHAAVFYHHTIKVNPASASAMFGLMKAVRVSDAIEANLSGDPDNFTLCTQVAIINYRK